MLRTERSRRLSGDVRQLLTTWLADCNLKGEQLASDQSGNAERLSTGGNKTAQQLWIGVIAASRRVRLSPWSYGGVTPNVQ